MHHDGMAEDTGRNAEVVEAHGIRMHHEDDAKEDDAKEDNAKEDNAKEDTCRNAEVMEAHGLHQDAVSFREPLLPVVFALLLLVRVVKGGRLF